MDVPSPKSGSIFFNHFIDMRTTVNLSISCRKNVFLLENFNKNTFFDRDARRSGPTIHFVGLETLVQNLL